MQYPEFVTLNKTISKTFLDKNIYWQKFESVIGNIYIEEENGFITKISFFRSNVSGKNIETDLIKTAKAQIVEFLNGTRKNFEFNLKVYASEFEIKVLKELLKINYGKTKSYLEIAKNIGCNGARAVGNACGKNPIALAIPCHRVIKADGNIGGYAGGYLTKEYLLNIEKQNY